MASGRWGWTLLQDGRADCGPGRDCWLCRLLSCRGVECAGMLLAGCLIVALLLLYCCLRLGPSVALGLRGCLLVASRLDSYVGWGSPWWLRFACRFATRSSGLGGTWATGPARLSLCDSLCWVGWNLGRWLLSACRFATRSSGLGGTWAAGSCPLVASRLAAFKHSQGIERQARSAWRGRALGATDGRFGEPRAGKRRSSNPTRKARRGFPPLRQAKKIAPRGDFLFAVLAERVGFEPTDGLPHRLISSQVHSTTLPPLLSHIAARRQDYSSPSGKWKGFFRLSDGSGRPCTDAALRG